MNETLKKLSAAFKANLESALSTPEWKTFLTKTKDASVEDSGTFEVVISTADFDRAGESIDQKGWNLELYKMNPVVLWGHDYYALPIGVCESIELVEGKLVAKGKFAPADANPFAQQVRKLYDAKIVRATSVGFIVSEMQGKTITKAELLEFSFVPVPANPYALSLAKAQTLGLDLEMVGIKGVALEIKAEGEVCTLDDGTEGIMNAEGVCVAKPAEEAKAKAEGDVCQLEDGSEGVIDADGNCVAKKPAEEAPAEEAKAAGDVCTLDDGSEGILVDDGNGTLTCQVKPAEKGAVADQITDGDAWEAKWKNLDQVCEIINAFFDVYLDEETPVENFGALAAEAGALIAALGGGATPTENAVKALVGKSSTHIDRNSAAAAKLFAAVGVAMNGAIGERSAGAVGEESRESVTPKPKVEATGSPVVKEFDTFFQTREILREINTATSNALAKMNILGRDKK